MAETTLGTAYIQIQPSAKGIKGSLTDAIGGEASEAGQSAGSTLVGKIKKALVTAGISTAIVKFMKSAINAGAELEQNLGGTEAVFGDYAESIQKSASEAYKKTGMSASEYMATANKMGSLFQGSGLDQARAFELSEAAMRRAADVASVMGVDTSAAMEAITGAAKGNFTMMDNLGVKMDATTLSAYALEKGMNFNWNTASEAEKAELAMQMFMDRTSQYADNFEKEATQTISGSFGMLKSSWTDLMGALATGGDVSAITQNLLSSVWAVGKNLLPAIVNVIKGLGEALIAAWPTIKAKIGELLSNAITWVTTKGGELMGNAINWLSTAVSNLFTNLKAWLSEHGGDVASKIFTWLGTTAVNLIKKLPSIFVGIAGVLGSLAISILEGLKTTLGNLFNGIKQKLSDKWDEIKANAKQKLEDIKNTIMKPFTDAINFVKGLFPIKLGKIFDGIKLPHFKISGGKIPWGIGGAGERPSIDVEWYAQGGIMTKPTLFGGGEAGAEAIVPLTPFWDRLERLAESMQGDVTINVYGTPGMSVNDLAEAVERRIINSQKRRAAAWL